MIACAIHQRVHILPLECEGRVMAIWEDSSGKTYKVRYFHNGDEKQVYFFADELAEKKP